MTEFKAGRWLPYVWSMLYLILLLSTVTTITFVTIHLIMVPVLVLFMALDLKRFIIFYGASLLVLLLLTPGIGMVLALFSIFFLPPVIAMAKGYKNNQSARLAVVFGSLTLLGELVMLLFIFKLAGFDPMVQFKESITNSIDLFPAEVKKTVNLDLLMNGLVQMLPLFMVAFSLYYVFITHVIGRFFLRKQGMSVPGFPPLRQLKLPRSFIFYFLIALILEFTIDLNKDTMLTMIVLNILPILTFAFGLQALSFLSYLTHIKKMNRALVILAAVLMIFPPILTLFSLLGLLDVSLPIRERFTTKS